MKKPVAIMMTRNEADIIEEALLPYQVNNIPVICMDDSDDGTFEILQKAKGVYCFRQEEYYGRHQKGSGDWMFQALLDKKRELYGEQQYVFLAMGDEVWHHNPLKIIMAMNALKSQLCIVHSCQFFLHIDDKKKWDFTKGCWKKRWQKKNNQERLSWYSPGYIAERRIFFDNGLCYYDERQSFDPLPRGVPFVPFPRYPIIKHYPLRNPQQILERAKDRVERHYQPFYMHSYRKSPEETFRLYFPDFRESYKYNGGFGEFEKGLEDLL